MVGIARCGSRSNSLHFQVELDRVMVANGRSKRGVQIKVYIMKQFTLVYQYCLRSARSKKLTRIKSENCCIAHELFQRTLINNESIICTYSRWIYHISKIKSLIEPAFKICSAHLLVEVVSLPSEINQTNLQIYH